MFLLCNDESSEVISLTSVRQAPMEMVNHFIQYFQLVMSHCETKFSDMGAFSFFIQALCPDLQLECYNKKLATLKDAMEKVLAL